MRKFLAFVYALAIFMVSQTPLLGQTYQFVRIQDDTSGDFAGVTTDNKLKVEATIPTGTPMDINIASIGGIAQSVGNGTADTGTIRVTLASDGTGHVIFWDGANTVTVTAAGAMTVDGSAVVQPVSGTFWQATQPVSGTFFQATQPVSIAAVLPVSQSGTWNIGTLTSITNPVTVTGTVTATPSGTQDTNLTQVAGASVATGHGTAAGSIRVELPTDGTGQVNAIQSGTWNITNVSGTVSLPTGAATAAKQPALGTAGTASADVITVQGKAGMTALVVDGSAVTQPVSAASLPLPIGAATLAKQPALGTAGTPSADVITVQGKSGMTALVVDPSGVTSPVSLASVPTHAVTQSGTWTVTTNSERAEDAAHSTGHVGQFVLGVRNDASAAFSGTDLDYTPIATESNGSVHIHDGGGSITVDGTVTATIAANQSVNVAQINGVTPLMGNGASGTGACRVTIANDSTGIISLTTSTAQIGHLEANQSTNIAQMNGVTVTMGNGVAGTGVQRVAIASDNTAFSVNAVQSGTWTMQPGNTANTTAWKVDGSAVTQPVSISGNQATNIAQINGVTPLMGNGATGTGALRVSIANDSTGIMALTTGSAQIGHLEANQSTNIAQMNGVTVTMGNGVAGTGVQRVAIASDNTAFSVNAVQSGTWNIGTVTTVTGVTNVATIGTSIVPGTSATHLGKAEDAAHTTGDTGVFALAVRNDAGTALAGTDGDYIPLSTDSSGALRVAATFSPSGTQDTNITKVAGAAISQGHGTAATAIRVELPTDGTGIVGITTGSAQIGHLEANQSVNCAQMNGVAVTMGNGASGTGVQRVTLASDSTGVIDKIVTSIVPGTSATHLGKAEDAAHTTGDTGVMALAVRNASLSPLADTEGDYVPLSVDAQGFLRTVLAQQTVYTADYITEISFQSSASANGNGSAFLQVSGYNSRTLAFEVFGTYSATVNFEASYDSAVTYVPLKTVDPATGTTQTTTTSTGVTYIADITGVSAIRARISGYVSGNVTVRGAVTHTPPPQLFQNHTHIAGVAVSTGNGASGTGVQRVTIANDSTGIVALTTGSAQIGHLEANQSTNIAQINGVAPTMGNGASGTGVQRVTIANDSTGVLDKIVTSIVPGTSATHLGKAEDAAHVTADTGVAVWGVRQDGVTGFCADGDYSPVAVDAIGAQKVVIQDNRKASYVAMNPAYTIPATPTDMIIFAGSATKTVKILRVEFFSYETSAGTNLFSLLKRSTAASSGTPNTVTTVPLDSNNAAATATFKYYTGNPTTGTLVGAIVDTLNQETPAATSFNATVQGPLTTLFDANVAGQPIVLRGTAESICLNFGGAALPTAMKVQMRVYWTEE